jgi:hypothetical protein
MSNKVSPEILEAATESAVLIAAKIHADPRVCSSLHEAFQKGAAAVAHLLKEQGLRDATSEHVKLVGWTDAKSAQGGGVRPFLFRCTAYKYELVATWDPWGGLDWKVVESCTAASEV